MYIFTIEMSYNFKYCILVISILQCNFAPILNNLTFKYYFSTIYVYTLYIAHFNLYFVQYVQSK